MIAFLLLAGLALGPHDWPRFQGPQRNGTSTETNLRRSWGEEGPPILWKVSLDKGFGGAAVRDGKVYMFDRVLREKDTLRCFDLATGEELWQLEDEFPGSLPFPGARVVPTVEEDLIYTLSGFGNMVAWDHEAVEEAWRISLEEDYGGEMPMFGWCQSPLVYGDTVVTTPLGPETGLVALDRYSSDELWTTGYLGSSHSTPTLIEMDGVRQVIMVSATGGMSPSADQPRGSIFDPASAAGALNMKGLVSSFDPDDGTLLWQSDLFLCRLAIPSPIKIDEHRLFVTGGYESGSVMLEIKRDDSGEAQVKELFRIARGAQIHIPMLYEDHLYVLVNANENNERGFQKEGGLLCLDMQGNEVWRTGNEPYFGRGNIMLADDMLIIQDGHTGRLRLVEPTPEEFRVIAEANVFEARGRPGRERDQQMWAPMALTDGLLLMRSQEELRCIDMRSPVPAESPAASGGK